MGTHPEKVKWWLCWAACIVSLSMLTELLSIRLELFISPKLVLKMSSEYRSEDVFGTSMFGEDVLLRTSKFGIGRSSESEKYVFQKQTNDSYRFIRAYRCFFDGWCSPATWSVKSSGWRSNL